MLLCRIAKAKGARVIGVISSAAKASAALAAGCDVVAATEQDDPVAVAKRFTQGQGVDVVFDPIGRETFDSSLAMLAARGHLVSFGEVSGRIEDRNLNDLARKSIRFSRPNVAHFMRDRIEIERRAARLFGYLRQGIVQVVPTSFPLGNAARAHEQLEGRRNVGPLILLPD